MKKNATILNNLHLTIALVLLIISSLAVSSYFVFVKNKDQARQVIEEIKNEIIPECFHRSDLDGTCLSDDEQFFVYGVMIDNHVEARPPANLDKARVVYETVVEIPITRLLAVFSSQDETKKIGPVRSARPFYVDWAKEFNGLYVHVGGSNEALEIIKNSYSYDMNEFAYGNYFWRDNTYRYQPHNAFTSSELINKLVDKNDWRIETSFDSWVYKPEAKIEDRGDAASQIEISFQSYDFNVVWEYSQEDNAYLRYQGGRKHLTEEKDEIKAKNIAVLYTDSEVIDSYGRRRYETVGSGRAIVFNDGVAVDGTWQRPDLSSRTRFYDENNKEISLNPGTTWIEILPDYYPEVIY
ncbi:DUF3048 domain-containing protein [Candidatus Falkowbacteria bacterium]|jgi:hypothetical protein|nr:DUF3048 domain-containing protein [Candidatus Falkowbacteria bacterium]MBT7007650.1 DUF3048 domain-containing protein [Candidatus Falkowbacteria bacterium]